MNDRNQRIGDMVAGTVVKKEKVYICGQCRQSLSLDQAEILRGQYVCPSCGAANHSLTVA